MSLYSTYIRVLHKQYMAFCPGWTELLPYMGPGPGPSAGGLGLEMIHLKSYEQINQGIQPKKNICTMRG